MWIDVLKGLLLGLVQGLTEFLPVSSSGHLLLLERMGVAEPSLLLNLLVHVATLLAVVIVMRRDVWAWIKHPLGQEARWIYLVSVPTVLVAALFHFFAPRLLTGAYLPLGFLATSCLLFWGASIRVGNRPLSCANALGVGLMHGLATLPGLSRSGATVSAMRLAGIAPDRAVRLSFLMSIPVIVGGAAVECIGADWGVVNVPLTLSAVAASFVFGLLGLRVMLRAFGRSMPIFGVYTLALAVVSLFV